MVSRCCQSQRLGWFPFSPPLGGDFDSGKVMGPVFGAGAFFKIEGSMLGGMRVTVRALFCRLTVGC